MVTLKDAGVSALAELALKQIHSSSFNNCFATPLLNLPSKRYFCLPAPRGKSTPL